MSSTNGASWFSTRLELLQRQLIQRGFDLLKPGGIMVYATCSFCVRQNENIVQWLLKTNPGRAVCQDLVKEEEERGEREECSHNVPLRRSSVLSETIYMDPLTCQTSGLFVAKIKKAGAPLTVTAK